jgi:hypothetical protein
MAYELALSNPDLPELYFQVWKSGCLDRRQRQQLQSLLLGENLGETECTLINRLLHAIRRGWISLAR